MEDQEIIREFIIESNENLARLEQEIIGLEQNPANPELLASIFRTVHSVKGTCGFLAFSVLESVTHIAENLLSQLRTGEKNLTPAVTSLILETADVIRKELNSIEATSQESGEQYEDLRQRLTREWNARGTVPDVQKSSLDEDADEIPSDQHKQEPDTGSSADLIEKTTLQRSGSIADTNIRVDVGLLDRLMNLVGELVLARNQILQFNTQHDSVALNGTAQRLNLITTQLQEGVMKTRMQPIGVIWNKLPRVVRDLASSCGKQISLEMDGAETELDKSIIEAIKDPLTHIVRNCCDHGIESPASRVSAEKSAQGRLYLRAYHEGGQVNIEITDDGGGVNSERVRQKAVEKGLLRQEQVDRMSDREAVNLVFLPGFSTTDQITSISGRGVGMDVVKTNIEKIGGVVDLISRPGEGTTVRIKIPLTLAIIPGLMVSCGGENFIIPQVRLLELLRLEGEVEKKQIEQIHGTPVYRRRGNLLPITYLREVLCLEDQVYESDVLNIVVLQVEDRQFGLVVDAINDTQEIVVKPLGKQLKGIACYAGATIMGDGKVALILDVVGIGQLSGILSESRDQARQAANDHLRQSESGQSFLLFKAGSFERLAVPLSSVTRLEEFPRDQIERASGKLVVQYRDDILQLTRLDTILEQSTETNLAHDPVPVIVFSEGNNMSGLVVDQIYDIHHESIQAGRRSSHPAISGSGVIDGKVTDFVDLPAVLHSTRMTWLKHNSFQGKESQPVLVADQDSFSRGLIRNYLELAGHSVIEASDLTTVFGHLERGKIRAVVFSQSLLRQGGKTLVGLLNGRADQEKIPVIEMTQEKPSYPLLEQQNLNGIDICADIRLDRLDRIALIDSLEKLSASVGDQKTDLIPEQV